MLQKLILILIFISTSLPGQENQIIKKIRNEYASIKNQLPNLKSDTLNIEGFSVEGSEAICYKDQADKLNLITLWSYGETGKSYEEFYFTNDSLFFLYSELYQYNAPYYLTADQAEAMGIEPFDSTKTTIEENRFYFHHHRLIRWLDPEKNQVETGSADFIKKEQELLEFLKELLTEINR